MKWICALSLLVCTNAAFAQVSIVLDERDAEVWLPGQDVRGHVEGSVPSGTLYVNERPTPFTTNQGMFSVPVILSEGTNDIVACEDSGVCSDTVRWDLRIDLRPEVTAFARVTDGAVSLHARIEESPGGPLVSYEWESDADNPSVVSVESSADSVAHLQFPTDAPYGEYYFDLTVIDSSGAAGRARTLVTLDATGIRPFDIWTDHAAWIDEAVIYEITPYIFVEDGTLNDIRPRLPELADLGVTTIWLQPVFETGFGGQGYDITNYFRLRPDYGTEDDLRRLVDEAHGLGLKVLLDFVPNHTSIRHRYAQDAIEHGSESHYYDFYQRRFDSVPYSQHYNRRRIGQMDFVYYFWDDLLNINYDNPEVRRWMIEAGRRWVEDFDIDGYRIDAVWGTNARTPSAMQEWRLALKRIKPEVLLLGEDKATWDTSFEGRFDVAYDWYPEESWVSHWTWQTSFSESRSSTLFNYSDERERVEFLREALTNRGDGWHPDAKVLRFMENNDTFRFLEHHTPEQSRMAAALLLSLPGVPLIYNGQEAGATGHPYQSVLVYRHDETLREQSRHELFGYYERLIDIRRNNPALQSDRFEEVNVSPLPFARRVYAFRRWSNNQDVVGAINLSDNSFSVQLELPVDDLDVQDDRTYFLTDLVTGEYFEALGSALDSIAVSMPPYTTRIMALADHVVEVPTISNPPEELPNSLTLEQNYPNPFNPTTTISFALPGPGYVRLSVFDVLGRKVASLLDGPRQGGPHRVRFDAGELPSGPYIYRLEYDGRAVTRSMILIR